MGATTIRCHELNLGDLLLGQTWGTQAASCPRLRRGQHGEIAPAAGVSKGTLSRISTAKSTHHACGYAMANAGHDTRLIQDWLGHRAIQHTARYTELSPIRFKNVWR